MAALTVRVDDELYQQLRRAAFEYRQPMSQIVANALRAYLRLDLTAIDRVGDILPGIRDASS